MGSLDDARQEAAIAVLQRAVPDYNPARGTATPFVAMVVRRHLVTVYKGNTASKRRPETGIVSLSHSPVKNAGYEIGDVLPDLKERAIADADDWDDITTRWKAIKLTAMEKHVVLDRARGYTFEEIAARRGTNYKSVDNALSRVARKVAERDEFEARKAARRSSRHS